jgi:class 3 adenylate cyclase
VVELVVDSGDESFIESHRREIVVVFCDLRQFTSFAEAAEPEEVMAVLQEYHAALGKIIFQYEGTLDRFTGDGLMVFFNDPIPCEDAPQRAVEMSVAMRDRVAELALSWRRRGHDLGFGIGVAQGYATLGRVGFEGRSDYTAIGSVINLSARLCAEAAAGQILVTQRVMSATDDVVDSKHVGDLALRGFSRPISVFDVIGIKSASVIP